VEKNSVESIVELRMMLINEYTKLKDYRSNKNAIMREIDHVKVLEAAIKRIDKILEGHVTFS
tara:strand:+ start:133 stop:318 length:186 start_codon:yes stop_codon:yes gene_type:complete